MSTPIIKAIPVQVIQEKLMCDCGGEMRTAGRMRPTYPPQTLHVCPDCGAEEWVGGGITYPRTIYKELPEEPSD